MAPPLLQLKDVALTFGGTPLLCGVELSVSSGERVALVGRNGSGKSTLLKIAAGQVKPDRGSVFTQPGAVVRYLPQEPDFSGFASTLAYVEAGLGPSDDPHLARYLLDQFDLTGQEDPANLSGGEARRTSLARVLAPSPDILLLDETTNHLDLTAIEWLERDLNSRRTALVLISLDRRFLSNLSRSTVWLDRGCTRRIDRGFAHFEEWRDKLLLEEESEQHKLDRKIVAEEHWMRYGVTGRRKRNMLRVGNLRALRERRRTYRANTANATITVGSAAPSGALVIEAIEYPGTVLLVSHDRDFLDRLVSSMIVPEGDGFWTEYAGGYSDMLAQRGAQPLRNLPKQEPQKAAQESVSNISEPPPAKRRMNFKDKHALDTLPKIIAALQAEAGALRTKLDDPEFYARDRTAFETTSAALAKLYQDIAAAEEQWLELEILREELAGATEPARS